MSPRAVFFDLDDTLVDDTGCYLRSIEGVCADLGPPFEADTLRAAYDTVSLPFWPGGLSMQEWLERVGNKPPSNIAREEVLAAFNELRSPWPGEEDRRV